MGLFYCIVRHTNLQQQRMKAADLYVIKIFHMIGKVSRHKYAATTLF